MSATRPKLKLDEQAFEGLLAAAFTIQRHNETRRPLAGVSAPVSAVAKNAEPLCPHCGASLKDGETDCSRCSSDQFRPGEQMQRKFASLWEMSQEQAALPSADEPTEETPTTPEVSDSLVDELSAGENDAIRIVDVNDKADVEEDSPSHRADWFNRFSEPAYLQEASPSSLDSEEEDTAAEPDAGSAADRPFHWWQTLNLPRADLYLAIAIVVAALAIIWPSPVASQRPRLQPWQRILVKLGIAEGPPAAVHYRGDPNIQVWVDPHTALYYCPGDEQYGKSANGRFAAQREAQLEQFEPASRTVCQ